MFKGTVIAQIIAVLAAIFLAKIYGTNAYGIFGTFMSLATILSITNTLQLEKCIVISKTKLESENWQHFLFFLNPIISVIITLFAFFIIQFFYPGKIDNTIILLGGFTAVILSFNKTYEAFLTFTKVFSKISFAKIIVVIVNITAQFILYSFYKNLGLIFGFIIASSTVFIYYSIKNKSFFKRFNFEDIKTSFQKNTSILRYLLPSNIINSIALHIMPILILTYFSAKDAGVYFFSFKILAAPLFLISSSISQVFFKKSAELYQQNKKELYILSKKIAITNTLIMIVFLLFINTVGIYLLELYLDNNWTNLREITLLLSFLILTRASFNPISSLSIVLSKNHISLIFNSYLFLVNIIAIYIGYLYNNILYSVTILSFFGGIGYLFLLGYFLRFLKKLQHV